MYIHSWECGSWDAWLWLSSYQQVLWLDVAVDDVQAMQVFDGAGQVVQHPTGISLRVFVSGSNGIKKVSALQRKQQAEQHANRWAMGLPTEWTVKP